MKSSEQELSVVCWIKHVEDEVVQLQRPSNERNKIKKKEQKQKVALL
ncbi:hypothetical protein D4764_16G0007830 [Takifugu flavidus]|uniref:Uncharacterized protein n=1 Tax=Takifugu flavidus TaxID=433684 RepID=A0A5C6NZL7_9TELE|nr:hypothetical protein D4764_16G0007830 [Takifugu flavidus]